MARQKTVIPSFTSESAEALWWEKYRADVEADLRAALRESGSVQPREVMTKGHKKKFLPVSLRLAGKDLDAARKIAEDRGIRYQDYIQTLASRRGE